MRTRLKASIAEDGNVTITQEAKTPVVRQAKFCRACQTGTLEPVLSLGNQYLVNFTKDADVNLPRAPLNLMRCDGCGLLQLEHTVDPELLYREFWYRSGINQSMKESLAALVKTGLVYHHGGTWLDIGANDGYLLTQVPPSFKKIACEPARNFTAELHEHADVVLDDFFTPEKDYFYGDTEGARHGIVDVVTTAAMFYDLDDPDEFVAGIVKVMSPNGIWINQLNDSPTMMERNAFDAICHEHLCYYDIHSLSALYARHGLAILDVTYNETNGGSAKIVAEKAARLTRPASLAGHRRVSEQDAANFAARTYKWRDRMSEMLAGSLADRDPIWLYGASTKGCALLQFLDMNENFRGIAERNPLKYGLKMAGTWLPIMPEDEMRASRPRHVVCLPWAFRDEFVRRERALLDAGTTLVFPLPNIEFVL